MFCNVRTFGVLLLATPLFANSLSAQSLPPLHQFEERDVRSSITLTIPLGGQRDAATSKPQLSLSFQQDRRQKNSYDFVSNAIPVRSNNYDFLP